MTPDGLTDALAETLSCFDAAGAPRTTTEVADELGLGRRSTYDRLQRLADAGHLETKKVGAKGRVWWRAAASSASDSDGSIDSRNPPARAQREGATSEPTEVPGESTEESDESTGGDRDHDRYETVVEVVQDGIYVVDEDGYFVDVNDAYESMVGRSREELVGEHVSEVIEADEVLREAKRLEAELAAGKRSTASLEAEFAAGDGESMVGEATFALMECDDGYEHVGVVRDVSDRNQFEEALKGLFTSARELLAAESEAAVSDVLVDTATDVLEVPGAVVYAREPGSESDSLVPDSAAFGRAVSGVHPSRVPLDDNPVADSYETGAAGWFGVDEAPGYVDLDAGGLSAGFVAPMGDHGVLVVGAEDREQLAGRPRRLVELLAANAEAAYDAVERDREVEQQRERLAALNVLNDVFRDVTRTILAQSSRKAIERVVCERLAAADSYKFAWIGGVDVASQTVELRTEAGVEGYLDDATISVDPDSELSRGPTGRALRTGETKTVQQAQAADGYEPWQRYAEEYGFRASAAVPIVHENTVYGVLNVYTARSDAFEAQERAVVSQLGRVVGHAISAAERKRALLGDEVVEVEFRITDVFEDVGVTAPDGGRITLDSVVPLEDDDYLVYGTATADAVDTVREMTSALAHWTSVTFRDEDRETGFELRLSDPPVLSAVASLGGSVEEAVFEDGDYRMALHLSPSTSVENISETVQDAYPAAELVARRQVTRVQDSADRIQAVLDESLTDRQHTALRAAYHAGFYGWPRAVSGEELASSLDVSPPTFFQHLRKAEAKVFDELFAAATTDVTETTDKVEAARTDDTEG